ncbi:hypothetical protein [Streptomyces sp. DH24]|uniref:hypothetical protein n=1 Tax=Streptomyces sp. DH24 TaxID=3040123 RepID=UPI0024413274|nr:hypothetical protein [Streptomyces sp. DH24]MDG9719994.1 hypothetical protein [Streptomyces sp. DH24]
MSLAALPEPAVVLAETDWGALEHAYGTAEDTPAQLVALLDDDQRTRSQALDHLHHVVHHQNTLYVATVPATLYVAGILLDPRTTLPVDKRPHGFPGPMRAELLGWLNSVADAAGDQAEATMRRFGFPPEDFPPFVRTREIRPLLFSAVSACFDDHDLHVHEAALTACIPLLDDPHLHGHRKAVAPLLRETLAVSALWQYQERAVEALSAWGEDTTGLEVQRDAFDVCNRPSAASSPADWNVTPPGDAADLPF